jgi:Fe-S cluster assembly scaffold protein SufB
MKARADVHGRVHRPKFNTATLHSAVVELVAMKGAKIQYVTVQNWSNNVFNLVTKRASLTRKPR